MGTMKRIPSMVCDGLVATFPKDAGWVRVASHRRSLGGCLYHPRNPSPEHLLRHRTLLELAGFDVGLYAGRTLPSTGLLDVWLDGYKRAGLIHLAIDSGAATEEEGVSLQNKTSETLRALILSSPSRDQGYVPLELRFARSPNPPPIEALETQDPLIPEPENSKEASRELQIEKEI